MDYARIARQLDVLADKSSRESLEQYISHLTMDSSPPQSLAKLLQINPWQAKLLELISPLIKQATSDFKADKRMAFITAPKGSSKTSLIAILCNHSLCYSKRNICIVCGASDKEQAQNLLQRMKAEASHNPWLIKQLNFTAHGVTGPTGDLKVISSDAPSSSGRIDDITILDEVSHWASRELWDFLSLSAFKRPHGVLISISNAGYLDSWQHGVWLKAASSPDWIAYDVAPGSAQWIKDLEQLRATSLPGEFRRLHENKWVSEAYESPFVTQDQYLACCDGKEVLYGQEHDYFIGIDYGLTSDRTCLIILHQCEDHIFLDKMTVWQGKKDNPVQVEAIEAWIEDAYKNYTIRTLVCDQFQLESTIQKQQALGRDCVRVNLGGNHLHKVSETLHSLITNQKIHFPRGIGKIVRDDGRAEDLSSEILQLIVKKYGQLGGWRIEHPEHGHDDRTMAIAITAYELLRDSRMAPKVMVF